mmetsp:Transcript_2792/g.6386  ORF Transcript_2792/g.6386 Transcript_2792/m.6386 type:complete len:210 (+) Transcript_2792:835-1464(+)
MRQVDLVQHHHLWFLRELWVEEQQLLIDGMEIAHGVRAVSIDDVQDDFAPLDVTEEGHPEAHSPMRPLQQPWDVGQHHAPPITGREHLRHVAHTQVGHHCGEGVVGYLWFGVADHRQQCALAGVGAPHQPHVGHDLELQVDPAAGAPLALLGQLRGVVGLRLEGGVAATPTPASGNRESVSLSAQFACQPPLLVPDHSARRHNHHQIRP